MGLVHRVYPGVYSLSPPPFGNRPLWPAAVLACGSGTLLSDLAAAGLLGFVDPPAQPHVAVTAGHDRRRTGIVVHRRTVARCDRSMRDGIPCTGAARTILGLARSPQPPALERALIRADSLRILNRRRLRELAADHSGRPGCARLLALLESDSVVTRSDSESDFFGLCRRAGVPLPLVNRRIEAGGRTFEVDFCWPSLRIAIEIDGYAFHGGRTRASADRDRDQLLAIAGWRIHRFTADQVRDDPDEVIRRLRLLLAA